MTNPTEKATTAAEAVKYLSNLAVKFNDSAIRPESAAQLLEAVTHFVESQKEQKLNEDAESIAGWAETVQLLLKRAEQLKAANKSGPAKGNIDEALIILDRLKDPAFAASRKKATDKVQPTMAVMPSVMVGDQRFVILGKSQVTHVPGGLHKPSAPIAHGEVLRAAADGLWDKVMDLVVRGADINEVDRDGNSALMQATLFGDVNAVLALIKIGEKSKTGVKFDLKNKDGNTAIDIAKHYADFKYLGTTEPAYKKIQLILEQAKRQPKGATASKKPADGALMSAISKGDAAAVESVLKAGVDPENAFDSFKSTYTPLMFAADKGNAAVVRILLKYGANALAVNNEGKNALDHALSGNAANKELVDVLTAATVAAIKAKVDEAVKWANIKVKAEAAAKAMLDKAIETPTKDPQKAPPAPTRKRGGPTR